MTSKPNYHASEFDVSHLTPAIDDPYFEPVLDQGGRADSWSYSSLAVVRQIRMNLLYGMSRPNPQDTRPYHILTKKEHAPVDRKVVLDPVPSKPLKERKRILKRKLK